MPDHMKREQLCCHTDSGNSTAVYWFKTLKKKNQNCGIPAWLRLKGTLEVTWANLLAQAGPKISVPLFLSSYAEHTSDGFVFASQQYIKSCSTWLC